MIQDEDYISGRLEGEKIAKGKAIYVFLGIFLSLLGIIISIFYREKPPEIALMDKSEAYILGFTESYQTKTRNINAVYTSVGCVLSFVVYPFLFGFFGAIYR